MASINTTRGTIFYHDFPLTAEIMTLIDELPRYARVHSPGDDLAPPEGYIRVTAKTLEILEKHKVSFVQWSQGPVSALIAPVDTTEIAKAIKGIPRLVESVENCTGFLALYGGARSVPADRLAHACEKRGIKPPIPSRGSALSRALSKYPDSRKKSNGRGRGVRSWELISETPQVIDGEVSYPRIGQVTLASGVHTNPADDLVWSDETLSDLRNAVTAAYVALRPAKKEILSAGEVSAWLAGTSGQITRLGALDIPHRGSAFFPKAAGEGLALLQEVVRAADCANITICPVDHRSNQDLARDLILSIVASVMGDLRDAASALSDSSLDNEEASKIALRKCKAARSSMLGTENATQLALTVLSSEIRSLENSVKHMEGEIARRNIVNSTVELTDPQSTFFRGVVSESLRENSISETPIEDTREIPELDLRDSNDDSDDDDVSEAS